MNFSVRVVLFFGVFCFSVGVCAQWHSDVRDVMGTQVRVELWHEDEVFAKNAMNAVMDKMRFVDEMMSPYISGSEVFRVNRLASQEPVEISQALFDVVDKALFYSRLSDGAFDISFSSVGHFYDYRAGEVPSDEIINKSLAAIDYRLVVLDSLKRSIFFKHSDVKIDLGGIAKGYAVDLAIDELKVLGVGSAIVSAGGDSRILGDRKGTPWIVGIRHPRKQGEVAVRIPLENSAISTSGDYERFFIDEEGARVHHIINPVTGRSVNKVQSVSILSPLSVDCDALSTTVFVLGVKKGLALVNRMSGVDAVIIDDVGMLHYSDDLLRHVK